MPHGITQCYLPPGSGDIPMSMRSAKTAELLEMSVGMWLRAGSCTIGLVVPKHFRQRAKSNT